jgi:hypothetical protein
MLYNVSLFLGSIRDCDGDLFDLFAQSRNPNSHLLIRGTHKRKLNHLEEKQIIASLAGFSGEKEDSSTSAVRLRP